MILVSKGEETVYALYEKQLQGSARRYVFKKQVSLFGCKSGYLPYLLKASLASEDCEPLAWHVNIDQAMKDVGQSDNALIINLKPNSSAPNLSLYEVVEVWGDSASGWTAVMFYLRGLFCDADPDAFNANDFVRTPQEVEEPIFSMMYLPGSTVQGGIIRGRWTPPGPAQSVLLWPETFEYFAEKAKDIIERTA